MLTNLVMFPVVGAEKALLILSAEKNDVEIKVELHGAKSTATDHKWIDPIDVGTISLSPYETKRVPLSLNNEAFEGRYGAIVLTSTQNGLLSSRLFTAWFSAGPGRDANPVSALGLSGGVFSIPFVAVPEGEKQLIEVAISNVGATGTARVQDAGGAFANSVEIKPAHTYWWSSSKMGHDVNGNGQILVSGSMPMTVGAYIRRPNSAFYLRPLPLA